MAGLTFKEMDVHNGMINADPGQYSNKEMVNLLNNYLARIFNISETDLPQPYAVGEFKFHITHDKWII